MAHRADRQQHLFAGQRTGQQRIVLRHDRLRTQPLAHETVGRLLVAVGHDPAVLRQTVDPRRTEGQHHVISPAQPLRAVPESGIDRPQRLPGRRPRKTAVVIVAVPEASRFEQFVDRIGLSPDQPPDHRGHRGGIEEDAGRRSGQLEAQRLQPGSHLLGEARSGRKAATVVGHRKG